MISLSPGFQSHPPRSPNTLDRVCDMCTPYPGSLGLEGRFPERRCWYGSRLSPGRGIFGKGSGEVFGGSPTPTLYSMELGIGFGKEKEGNEQ